MEKPKFYKKKLKNGMTVLFEKRNSGVISITFAVKQGGIDETISEKGISHFIEHLLFKGTKKRTSKQISDDIERRGGNLNAFTEEEVTAYWCKIPSEHLNLALDVLTDMIKNSVFDEKEVNKERQVIFEELKLYKDNPRSYVFDKIKELLYQGAFAMHLGGTEKSMTNNTREKVVQKFREVYDPSNMVLCVVGDADFAQLCDFVEKNFKSKKKIDKKIKIEGKNFELTEKRKGIDQANLVFAFHVPNAQDEKAYAASTLNSVMADGMSSRLFQEIREKRNLAYAVKGSCNIGKNFGYITIYVGTSKENVQLVKNLIIEEFEKVSEELQEKELEEAKEQLIGNNKISREDSQIKMVDLLYHEIYNKAENSYNYEKNIRKVKLEDVKKLAKIKNYSFFALIPE